eukprot:maker-scaffold184_size276635-snap-gene-1.33 protein:Tk08112 transcript:maker-scaffold184_size276635-snap-gene-1.33-mRNA-1 annotation:"tyrosine recombinase"
MSVNDLRNEVGDVYETVRLFFAIPTFESQLYHCSRPKVLVMKPKSSQAAGKKLRSSKGHGHNLGGSKGKSAQPKDAKATSNVEVEESDEDDPEDTSGLNNLVLALKHRLEEAEMRRGSVRNYIQYVRSFLEFCQDALPNVELGDMFASEDPNTLQFLPPSVICDYACICSSKKVISMIKSLRHFFIMHGANIDLMELPSEIASQAQDNMKSIECQMDLLHQTAIEAQRDEEIETQKDPPPPGEGLPDQPQRVLRYVQKFATSTYVKDFIVQIGERAEEMVEDYEETPAGMRNVVLVMLFLASGGRRGICIRDITLGDWLERKVTKFKGMPVHIVRIQGHKNCGTPAMIALYDQTVALALDAYCKHVRPSLVNPQESDGPHSPLFLSTKGRKILRLRESLTWLGEILVSKLKVKDLALDTLNETSIVRAWQAFGTTTTMTRTTIYTAEGQEEAALRSHLPIHRLLAGLIDVKDHFGRVETSDSDENSPEEEISDSGKVDGWSDPAEEEDEVLILPRRKPFNRVEQALLLKLFKSGGKIAVDEENLSKAIDNHPKFKILWQKVLKDCLNDKSKAKKRIRSGIRKL